MAEAPSFRDFRALDGDQGHQRGGVDEGDAIVGLRGGQHLAATVQQHQRGADAEAAQVDAGGAGGLVLGEGVRIVLGTGVDGQRLGEISDVLRADRIDIRRRDGLQGRG